jgi:hypothetical protein
MKNRPFSFFEYRQNSIDAVESRNNTHAWTKAHPIKPQYSVWGWIKSIFRFYFSKKPKDEKLNSENLDFANM